jgi:hypothetical protein
MWLAQVRRTLDSVPGCNSDEQRYTLTRRPFTQSEDDGSCVTPQTESFTLSLRRKHIHFQNFQKYYSYLIIWVAKQQLQWNYIRWVGRLESRNVCKVTDLEFAAGLHPDKSEQTHGTLQSLGLAPLKESILLQFQKLHLPESNWLVWTRRERRKPCFIGSRKRKATIFSIEDPNVHPVINLTSILYPGNASLRNIISTSITLWNSQRNTDHVP